MTWDSQTENFKLHQHRYATQKFVDNIAADPIKNFSLNLRYTHLRVLLLVEILEQPMRMLKNEHSVDLC